MGCRGSGNSAFLVYMLLSAELTSAALVSVLVSIGKRQEAQGEARQCAGCACLLGFMRFLEQVAQQVGLRDVPPWHEVTGSNPVGRT